MKLSKLYTDSTPGPILFQGLLGIVTGLVLAALYSLFAHENGLRRFAFAIVALPITLTALKLLFYLGTPPAKSPGPNDQHTPENDSGGAL